MKRQDTDSKSLPNRRALLAATAAVASGGVLGRATASPGQIDQDKKGQTTFGRVLLRHQDTPNFPITHVDRIRQYSIDKNRGISVKNLPTNAAINENPDVGALIEADGLNLPGENVFGEKNSLARISSTRLLSLAKPYKSPSVKLGSDSENLKIQAEKHEKTVAPRKRGKIKLSPREVEVWTLDREMEKIKVTPEVIIENHGAYHVNHGGQR